MGSINCQVIYDYRLKRAVVVFLSSGITIIHMVKRATFFILSAIIGCSLLFVATNPESVPSALFIGVFVLVYGFVYGVMLLIGAGLRTFGVITWTEKRLHRTVLALACYPVFLLILQSIGQLTVRDVILATGFFVLAYLYAGRVFLEAAKKTD